MLEAGDLAVAAIEHAGQGDQHRCDQRGGRHKRRRGGDRYGERDQGDLVGCDPRGGAEHERGGDPLGYGAVQFRRDGAVEGLARVREEETAAPAVVAWRVDIEPPFIADQGEDLRVAAVGHYLHRAGQCRVAPRRCPFQRVDQRRSTDESADIEGIVVVQVFVDELNLVASEADLHGVRGGRHPRPGPANGQQPRRLGRARALTCGGVP